MTTVKYVAEIDKTIRVVEHTYGGNVFYKIEEIVTRDGNYTEWVTLPFVTLWDALREVTKELDYRSATTHPLRVV